MPSLPSPETTMTLAGVGMVRFIPTLLSFSFSSRAVVRKSFVFVDSLVIIIIGCSSFVRDGLKTNSPNKLCSPTLSLFRAAARSLTNNYNNNTCAKNSFVFDRLWIKFEKIDLRAAERTRISDRDWFLREREFIPFFCKRFVDPFGRRVLTFFVPSLSLSLSVMTRR